MIKVQWLGHSCFLFTSQYRRLLTDPFDDSVGYPLPKVDVDYVTVSHQHHDHNAVGVLPGRPTVIEGNGSYELTGLFATGIATFHDHEQGRKRGTNTVFILKWDGLRICHMGDLGHLLSPSQVAEVGTVDILCIPVGGFYTIDAIEAVETVRSLAPAVVLPMHYKTDFIQYPIAPVLEFTKHFQNVEYLPSLQISSPLAKRGPRIVVLDLANPLPVGTPDLTE